MVYHRSPSILVDSHSQSIHFENRIKPLQHVFIRKREFVPLIPLSNAGPRKTRLKLTTGSFQVVTLKAGQSDLSCQVIEYVEPVFVEG